MACMSQYKHFIFTVHTEMTEDKHLDGGYRHAGEVLLAVMRTTEFPSKDKRFAVKPLTTV